MIEIVELTKNYGNNKGIFDLSFSIPEGEVFGYLGPNGAGKTTTIRHLLGFITADHGTCFINNLHCRHQAAPVRQILGYLPEESAYFEDMTGTQFLGFMDELRRISNRSRRQALVDRFELGTAGRIRKMSKGMRQKLGLVAAFMHDPAVYILDEPTSGLDPLMQNAFIDLILEEKHRGKTILMSSHRFDEIERTCDRAGIIRSGRLQAVEDIQSLKTSQRKAYIVTVGSRADVATLRSAGLTLGTVSHNRVEVFITGDFGPFIHALGRCQVLGLDVGNQNLEQVFMKYYGSEATQS